MISAVVLTKNASEQILKCVHSLAWCDEIIVIDDYSTDDTLKKAQNANLKSQIHTLKMKIHQRQLNNDFARQRNFALDQTSQDWVLFVDADEYVPSQLAEEIQNTLVNDPKSVCGYLMKRDDLFLGRQLKHGETAGIWLLRLARKNAGIWQGKVHEKWNVGGEVGRFKNPLMHNSHQSISSFLQKINWYTDVLVSDWMEEKRVVPVWQIFIYPKAKFIYNYVFRFGFLDGIPGLIMALMMSFHSFMARSKYWIKTHKGK